MKPYRDACRLVPGYESETPSGPMAGVGHGLDDGRMSTQIAPALRGLEAFVGEWTMHPTIGGQPAALGRTTFDWSVDGAFLVQHADAEPSEIEVPAEWRANSPFPTDAVIGLDEDSHEFTMLYGDARQVFRVYRMTLAGDTWTVWRETPGFRQRYVGRFSADASTITGGWESSDDGVDWRPDFDLDYRRVG